MSMLILFVTETLNVIPMRAVPVLSVLEKENVTDVCVVVTRYFGGILLGGGGLVRAYSHAAHLALEAGKVITMGLCAILEIRTDYASHANYHNG